MGEDGAGEQNYHKAKFVGAFLKLEELRGTKNYQGSYKIKKVKITKICKILSKLA